MQFLHILFEPAILIVLVTFLAVTGYYVKKVFFINREVTTILNFIRNFKKADLAFRFKELDTELASNPYISNVWAEFKNTLVFSESVSLKNDKNDIVFQNVSQSISNIQTTVDPIYFFNEETLVTAKLNYKFIQTVPTILTGMGPLFTFLNIAFAFAAVNFSTQEATIQSVSHLMSCMQVAALVSVLAVGSSILFLIIERILYNTKCKLPLNDLQEALYKLFDNISSEKFLIELLKETKIQNNNTTNLLSNMPSQFKDALDKSMKGILVPYLENLVFGLNKLQEKASTKSIGNSDIVDDLFKG